MEKLDNVNDINIEQIEKIREVYESNKQSLEEVNLYIKENAILDNGLNNPTESFEQGYNNAIEFICKIINISL